MFSQIKERIIDRLLKSIPVSERAVWFSKLIVTFEKESSFFINYRLYPKKTDTFTSLYVKTDAEEGEFAIIIQGPIDMTDSFTFESIRLYRKIFPKASIIVSTWDDTAGDVLGTLQTLGAHVVINKSFDKNGYGNINFQICTTLNGLKKAKELGAKYCLKTRADWRIYREYSLEFLKSLMLTHPISENNSLHIKGRIISGGGGNLNFCMPFWLPDFMYFGYTDDLINLFDIPYDTRVIKDVRKFNRDTFGKCYTGRELVYFSSPEIHIMGSFMDKYKNEERTIKNHWKNLKEYFMIIDPEMINAYWHKYDYVKNLSRGDFWDGKNNDDSHRNFRYVDFENIYTGAYQYDESYEKFMDGRIVRT